MGGATYGACAVLVYSRMAALSGTIVPAIL